MKPLIILTLLLMGEFLVTPEAPETNKPAATNKPVAVSTNKPAKPQQLLSNTNTIQTPTFFDGVLYGVAAAKRNPDVEDTRTLVTIAITLYNREHPQSPLR